MSRAEPPALVPISALLSEPAAIELVSQDAIVVPIDGEHALQSYREPLPATHRRRARLRLASAGALLLAASAASAYVILQSPLAPELPAPTTQPTSASRVAKPVLHVPARPLVAPAVAVEGARPMPAPQAPRTVAPALARSELTARAREPRWRAGPRIQAQVADKREPTAGSGGAALEPVSVEPLAAIPAPEAMAMLDSEGIADNTAPEARAPAEPRETSPSPAPDPAPPVRARSSVPLAATPEIRELAVRGSLATSEVRRALDRIKPQLAACYAGAARTAGRNSFGELRFEVEIDERGRGHAPLAKGSSLPGLERCLERAVSKLAARPPDTGTVKASWKVVFEP